MVRPVGVDLHTSLKMKFVVSRSQYCKSSGQQSRALRIFICFKIRRRNIGIKHYQQIHLFPCSFSFLVSKIALDAACGPEDQCKDNSAECRTGACRCLPNFFDRQGVCSTYLVFSYLIHTAPLHRFYIVSEALYNIHLCKAFQCFIPF